MYICICNRYNTVGRSKAINTIPGYIFIEMQSAEVNILLRLYIESIDCMYYLVL